MIRNPDLPIALQRLWLYLIIIAIIIRFATLPGRSIWLDEAASLRYATIYDADTIWNTVIDASPETPRHPPLYYLILHHAINLTGVSEGWLRLPSAIFSTAGIGLFYLLARRLFSANSFLPLASATLLAFSPLDLWYAQETRMYALVTLCGIVIMLGYVMGNFWGAILLAAGTGVGLYADFVMVPLWAGITALWLLYCRHQRISKTTLFLMAAGNAAGWIAFQPWWRYLARLFEILNNIPTFISIRAALGLEALPAWFYGGGLAFFIILIYGNGWITLRLWRRDRWKKPILVVIIMLFCLVTLIGAIPRLYMLKRIGVTGMPLLILVVSWASSQIRIKSEPVYTLPAFLIIFSLMASVFTLLTPKDDWRAATAFLASQEQSGAVVIFAPSYNEWMFNYYRRPQLPAFERQTPTLAELDVQANQLWLVAERFNGVVPSSETERLLDENWRLLETKRFFRLELRRYGRN